MKKTFKTYLLSGLLALVLALALVPALTPDAQAADGQTPVAQSYEPVWYTPEGGSRTYGNKPYYTIDEAWDAACEGTAIQLTADWILYGDGVNRSLKLPDGKSATLYLDGHTIDRNLYTDDVLWKSHNPNSYDDYGGIFRVGAGASLTIDGADKNGKQGVLQNGFDSHEYERGGAVLAYSNATVQIENTQIKHCSAWDSGGAIYADENTTVILNNVDIDECDSSEDVGGVIYMKNGNLLRMTGGTISRCESSRDDGLIYVCGVDDVELSGLTFTGAVYKDITIKGYIVDYDSTGVYAVDCKLSITNCTFQKCWATTVGCDKGGGVYARECDSVTIRDTHFWDCWAEDYGGGLYLEDNSSVELTDVDVSGCSVDDEDGGGIYMENNGAATFTNVTISNCKTSDDGSSGGGIYILDGDPVTMTNVNVFRCTSYIHGGGIYMENTALQMTDSIIDGCTALGNGNGISGYGGGICLNVPYTESTKTATLTNVTFNSCQGASYGGGLNTDRVDLTVTNCKFRNCQGARGGGLSAAGVISDGKECSMTLRNTEFSGCKATKVGGGLYYSSVKDTIDGCLFHDNQAPSGGGLSASSLFEDPTLGITNTRIWNNTATYGGVYVPGRVNLSSGVVIEQNEATTHGGGVYGANNSKITVAGDASIRENTAKRGGGIYAADAKYSKGSLVMKDQVVITDNSATEEYGGGVYAEGNIDVTVGGTLHLTGNKAAGKADDLCMNGSLTTENLVTTYTGMDLMKNARIGISSANNVTIDLGRAPKTGSGSEISPSAFYCTDPDMEIKYFPPGSDGSTQESVRVVAAVPNGGGVYRTWGVNSFSIEGQRYCEVDAKAATIHVTMPKGTDLTKLTACFDGEPVTSYKDNDLYTPDGGNYYYGVDVAMLKKGDFSQTVAYSFQTGGYYNYVPPLRVWYITVDCADVDYAAYTVEGSSRIYYKTFTEAWAYANAHHCTVGLLKDLRLSAPLTVNCGGRKEVTLDLNGYTLDRGLTAGTASANGYAFRVESNTYLVIQDSSAGKTGKVTGCHNTGNGGVFNQASGSKVTIYGGTFTGNSAQNGAILYLENSNTNKTAAYIWGGTFSGNTARENGGVVCSNAGKISIGSIYGDLELCENHAGKNGGVLAELSTSTYITTSVYKTEMRGNSAGENGGAIYYAGSTNGGLTIQESSFTGNQADGQGGGIYVAGPCKTLNIISLTTIKENSCGAQRDRQNTASNLYLTGNSLLTQIGSNLDVYVGSDYEWNGIIFFVADLGSGTASDLTVLKPSVPGYRVIELPVDSSNMVALQIVAKSHVVTVKDGTLGNNGNTRYATGDTVTITADPAPVGQIFDKWVCEAGGITFADEGATSTTFTMLDDDVTVRATYKDGQKYTVTVDGGTLENGTSSGEYAPGRPVTITADEPEQGKEFKGWAEVNDAVTFADASARTTTFTMPERDVTVRAICESPAEIISTINISVNQPEAGEPLGVVNLSEATTKNVTYLNFIWMDSDAKVVTGEKAGCNTRYLFMVTMTPASSSYKIPLDVEVTFNGQPATRSYQDADGNITAYYQFEATGPDTLERVKWQSGIDSIVIKQGQKPTLPSIVEITTKCNTATTATVTWSPEPTTATSAGTVTYTGTLMLPEGVTDPNNLGKKTVTVTVKALTPVGKITITPERRLNGTVKVTITCDTPYASIYYTVDNGSKMIYGDTPFVLGDELVKKGGGSNVYVLRVTASKNGYTDRTELATIEVNVPKPSYTVNITGGKVVSGALADGKVIKDSLVAIEATPQPNQVFRSWKATYTGKHMEVPLTLRDANASTTTFTMPSGNVTIKADFVTMLQSAALTMPAPSSGESLSLPETASWNGSEFPVSWTTAENGDKIDCTATITIPADLTPTKDRYFANGATATINSESATASVSDGSLTVTKTYKLTKPTGPLYTVTLLATVGQTGQVTPIGSYPAGSTVTLTAPEIADYSFLIWAGGMDDETEAELTEGFESLDYSIERTATFTMPAQNISIIAIYTPLITGIDLTIPTPEAGQPLAQYPEALTLTLANGRTMTDAELLKNFPISWNTTDETAVFGKQYVAVLLAAEGENGNVTPMADTVTVRVNGVEASSQYDPAAPATGAYYVRQSDSVQIFNVFLPAPATLQSISQPEPIHDIEPGAAYSTIDLPTRVEVQTTCGPMLIPVTWPDATGSTPNDGTKSVTLTGTLDWTNFTALDVPSSIDTSVTLRIHLDKEIKLPDKVSTPTAVPMGAGTGEAPVEYAEQVSVTLECLTPGASIYYTTDGTTPTEESTPYTAPILLDEEGKTTIQAIAVCGDMTPSDVATFTYTVYKTYPVTYRAAGTEYSGGRYCENANVEVVAQDLPGMTFKSWKTDDITLADATAREFTFKMPAHAVVLEAQYEANAAVITALRFTLPKLTAGQTLPAAAAYTVTTPTGSAEGEISISWTADGTAGDPGTPIVKGTTYSATIKFEGTVMEGYQFSGAPSVSVQSKAADGSLTDIQANCTPNFQQQSVTVTFSCTEAKPKLQRIEAPAALSGLPNGITLDAIKAQLGSTLTLVTDSGSVKVPADWAISEGNYDPNSRDEQRFTLTGTVTIPDTIDQNNVANTVTVSVTVSEKGITGAPIADPDAGTYTDTQTVTLTSLTPGASIYYTTDGTTPTEESTLYTGPITVSETTTLKAIAVKRGMTTSIATYVYTISKPVTPVTPVTPAKPGSTGKTEPCTGGANCPSLAFSDLSTTAWYHLAVDYVLNNKLMSGVGNSQFRPNGTLSRAMLAQILYNAEKRPAVTGRSNFNDVAASAWYADAVAWASANGIVSGYGSGLFGANDPITREQLALMLWRYAGSPAASGKALSFPDAGQIHTWALEAVRWATDNGILTGYADGRLDPSGNATRAQVAQMLMRYFALP